MTALPSIVSKPAKPQSETRRFHLEPQDVQMAVGLAFAGLVLQLPGLLWGAPNGKTMNNALRILAGDVPYRDFWTMYAPGSFYLSALLLKLFGTHVWVLGVAAQVLVAIDAAVLFVIGRRLGLSRAAALAVGGAFVCMQWSTHVQITTYESALVLLLLALDRVVCYAQGGGARALWIAGVLLGVAAWFKHDVSLYVLLACATGLTAAWMLTGSRRPVGWIAPAGLIVRLGTGALAGILPMAAYVMWNAGPEALQALIIFPATDFRVVRGEGYPTVVPPFDAVQAWLRDPWDAHRALNVPKRLSNWIHGTAPQIVFVAALVALARGGRALSPANLAVAAVSLAPMPLFWTAAHVQQNTHLTSMWIFSALLGAVAWISSGRWPSMRTAVVGFLAVYTGGMLIEPVLKVAEVGYFWNTRGTLTFPSAAGISIPGYNYAVYEPIVSYIRANVPESEPIYVGLVRHDSVVVSNQTFYYLSGRPIASRYNELHPGIVDREEIQREIIADLTRLNVRCAVLWDFGWPQSRMNAILAERQRHIPEIGSTILDEYLQREFQRVARHGEYVVLRRRDVPLRAAAQNPAS